MLKKLWNRYNPRRKYFEMDDDMIVILAQLGYIELYRGEYFFTDAGIEAINDGLRVLKESK